MCYWKYSVVPRYWLMHISANGKFKGLLLRFYSYFELKNLLFCFANPLYAQFCRKRPTYLVDDSLDKQRPVPLEPIKNVILLCSIFEDIQFRWPFQLPVGHDFSKRVNMIWNWSYHRHQWRQNAAVAMDLMLLWHAHRHCFPFPKISPVMAIVQIFGSRRRCLISWS